MFWLHLRLLQTAEALKPAAKNDDENCLHGPPPFWKENSSMLNRIQIIKYLCNLKNMWLKPSQICKHFKCNISALPGYQAGHPVNAAVSADGLIEILCVNLFGWFTSENFTLEFSQLLHYVWHNRKTSTYWVVTGNLKDSRYDGEASDFVKMLRISKLFMDSCRNSNLDNIVLALTHADRPDIHETVERRRQIYQRIYKNEIGQDPMDLLTTRASSYQHSDESSTGEWQRYVFPIPQHDWILQDMHYAERVSETFLEKYNGTLQVLSQIIKWSLDEINISYYI